MSTCTTPLYTKTQKHFMEKRERIPPPTAVSLNTGAELRQRIMKTNNTHLNQTSTWELNCCCPTMDFKS